MPWEWGSDAMKFAQRWVPERVIGVLGLPFAWTMVSYPGVLLETTANPVWSRSHFLGPLFAASSMSSGAAALTLLNYGSKDHGLHKALGTFEDVAGVAEAAGVALYLGEAKRAARPLWKGKQSLLFMVGAIGLGIVAPALLRRSGSKWVRDGRGAFADDCGQPGVEVVGHVCGAGVRAGSGDGELQWRDGRWQGVLGAEGAGGG